MEAGWRLRPQAILLNLARGSVLPGDEAGGIAPPLSTRPEPHRTCSLSTGRPEQAQNFRVGAVDSGDPSSEDRGVCSRGISTAHEARRTREANRTEAARRPGSAFSWHTLHWARDERMSDTSDVFHLDTSLPFPLPIPSLLRRLNWVSSPPMHTRRYSFSGSSSEDSTSQQSNQGRLCSSPPSSPSSKGINVCMVLLCAHCAWTLTLSYPSSLPCPSSLSPTLSSFFWIPACCAG